MNNSEKLLLEVEKRFKETCGLTQDISIFPLTKKIANLEINKAKSKEFSEVFTPLWLVDEMIGQVKFSDSNIRTLDLCAGYGQFSVRLMRHLFDNHPNFNSKKFLTENHAFSELQLSSCYKLLNVFSPIINLFIGDSTYLNRLPEGAKGIWCYIETYGKWVCLTETIKKIFLPNGMRSELCSDAHFVKLVSKIINNLNKGFTAMKKLPHPQLTLEQIGATEQGRLDIIRYVGKETKELYIQNVFTPSNVITSMLEGIDVIESKSILVMFNCEIVEQLIHRKKIDPKKIIFAIDEDPTSSNGISKCKLLLKMYGVESIYLKSYDEKGEFSSNLAHNSFGGKRFDLCLSNPPYNRGLDLKILCALIGDDGIKTSIAKEYVFVHPATWLLDQKNIFDLYADTKKTLAGALKSVILFNGYHAFKCEGLSTCTITHIDLRVRQDQIKVFDKDSQYTAKSIYDITKFGKDWATIVKSFVIKVESFIRTNGNVWSHNTRTINPQKIYCQLAAIIGHTSKDGSSKVGPDFFTLTIRSSDENKDIRQPYLHRKGNPTPTFGFDSEKERDNFLSSVNTDFMRFCLAILKVGKNAATGEMSLMPWLDFTQSWDDEKLFKYFDINQETQDYIRDFLPDYYGIRKQKTNGTTASKTINTLQTPNILQTV
jgi:hypothetical protein